MTTYRVYFRDHRGIVGRDDFDAPDDGAALSVAEQLYDALSDACQSFELWEHERVVSPVASDNAEAIRERTQAIVIEREEAIQSSIFAIRSSRRLLDLLNQARAAKA